MRKKGKEQELLVTSIQKEGTSMIPRLCSVDGAKIPEGGVAGEGSMYFRKPNIWEKG